MSSERFLPEPIELLPESIEQANRIFAWLQDPTIQDEQPDLDGLSLKRLSTIADSTSLEPVLPYINQLRSKDKMIVQLLLAGFSKQVMEELFDEARIYRAVASFKKLLKQANANEAEDAKATILDFPRTAELLSNLRPHPEWGRYIACTSDDDQLLSAKQGRGSGVDDRARLLCNACLVRLECLKDAIDNKDRQVIRGGMSDSERDKFAKTLGIGGAPIEA